MTEPAEDVLAPVNNAMSVEPERAEVVLIQFAQDGRGT